MKLTKIAGALLAVLVITGSAAALPGAAGAQADDNAQADGNAAEQAATETTDAAENDSDEAADRRGPPADAGNTGDTRSLPADLPEQVPDFVSEVHTLIGQKQAGTLTGDLGAQISDLTPGNDSEDADNASESADADADSDDAENADEESTDDMDVDDEQATDDMDGKDDEDTEDADEQSTGDTDADSDA